MSHPVWDAWIEISPIIKKESIPLSHPVWDAWIEMDLRTRMNLKATVASRMGCVD